MAKAVCLAIWAVKDWCAYQLDESLPVERCKVGKHLLPLLL